MKTASDFLTFLDGLDLPHGSTVRELADRHGVSTSRYYGWNIVELASARRILPQQVDTFWVHIDREPDLLPPSSFSAFISHDADARRNHEKTLDSLRPLLGAPTDASVSNALRSIWRFGMAALEIATWPPELNRTIVNPAHARHPEMQAYCHLRLTSGYRPALAPEELDWLGDVRPFSSQGAATPRIRPFDAPWPALGRGVYRSPPAGVRPNAPILGTSADTSALVGVEEDDVLVLAKRAIKGVRLDRVFPARGPGGASLCVRYVDSFSSSHEERTLTLFVGTTPAALDALAAEIARWAGVELGLSEQDDD